MNETRERIVRAAIEVLGRNPDAGMGEIASAAGVVRRTVYGHFPARGDLIRALARRAVDEMVAVLVEVDGADRPADEVWVEFVGRVWPVAHRYRVLLVLRRGEFGEEIHGLLEPLDTRLAKLVERGQGAGVFGDHLRADTLSQLAYAGVFTVAESDTSDFTAGARAAMITSLLTLGVPAPRAQALAEGATSSPR